MKEFDAHVPDDPIVLVCQVCGRARWFVGWEKCVDEEGWWVDLHRDGNCVVIRCPRHISEWALQQSMIGRTNSAREKAAEGRLRPVPIGAGKEPLPLSWRGADALLGPLRAKYQRRAAMFGGEWQDRVDQWVPEAQGEEADEVHDAERDATS